MGEIDLLTLSWLVATITTDDGIERAQLSMDKGVM